MTGLRDELEKTAASPLLVGVNLQVTLTELCRLADELVHDISDANITRVLIRTDDAGLLLAGLIATIDRGVDAVLASESYGTDVRDEIVGVLQINAVIESSSESPGYRIVKTVERIAESSGCVYLLTSGTTSTPKLVKHKLSTLLNRALASVARGASRSGRWLLTYLPASFAGFQVVLTGAIRGTLVIPSSRTAAGFVRTAHEFAVTHITGTPTFWRSFLLANGGATLPSLRQITLGGEACDQTTLDRLSTVFPGIRIAQVYGSTEGGIIFSVNDAQSGFPAAWLTDGLGDIKLRIRDGELEVKTPLRMLRYVSTDARPFSEDHWLATGDLVEVQGNRVNFLGRRDDVINVGGAKLYPNELEAFLLSLPGIRETKVKAQSSPISGQVVVADIVVQDGADPEAVRANVMHRCREGLADFKVPRIVRVVPSVSVAVSGKKA